MTNAPSADPLTRYSDDALARPIPQAIHAARRDLLAAVEDLRTIRDTDLTKPWSWKGGSKEELRYGFYRIGESFELASIEARDVLRHAGSNRGRAADRIAPATAARWDLHGLLLPLADETWDADPGGGEWTVRQTLGHVIASQRGYAATSAWWQAEAISPDESDLPAVPESIFDELPTEEAEVEGTPAAIRARIDETVDRATERLAGLPADRLAYGARWSGFRVDVGFRMSRWSSHLREHTIQVEKTLAMLDLGPTEVDRLVRNVLAAWGRAEEVVWGDGMADQAVGVLVAAAGQARATAADVAGLASS